jgi:hypothetical protein
MSICAAVGEIASLRARFRKGHLPWGITPPFRCAAGGAPKLETKATRRNESPQVFVCSKDMELPEEK